MKNIVLYRTLPEAVSAVEEEELKLVTREGKRPRKPTAYKLTLAGELHNDDTLKRILDGESVYCVGAQPQQMSRAVIAALGFDLTVISRRAIKSPEMQQLQNQVEREKRLTQRYMQENRKLKRLVDEMNKKNAEQHKKDRK